MLCIGTCIEVRTSGSCALCTVWRGERVWVGRDYAGPPATCRVEAHRDIRLHAHNPGHDHLHTCSTLPYPPALRYARLLLAAMAAAKGWTGQVQTSMLTGSLGYALGTLSGLAVARVAQALG